RHPRPTAARWQGRSRQLHLGAVAQHEAQCLGQLLRAPDHDLLADQAVFDLDPDVEDLAVLEDDRMLELAVADLAAVIDRGEGTDVGVGDLGALADDRRATDHAATDFGALLDDDLADELRTLVHGAGVARPAPVEHAT